MQRSSTRVAGILPPVTTPFDSAGRLDTGALAANVAQYNETGLAGFVAMGSNGEAVHLTAAERGVLVETIKRYARPHHLIVAGVNELSTMGAIDAARQAADCGADVALVITPYYYKSSMTGAALALHFTEVADASPIPTLLYNVPQNTGVVIDASTIAALAAHPNVVGVKDSAGNFGAISDTIRQVPGDFAVMCGNGGILYPALLMGAAGAILAVACAAPRACVDLYEAVRAGDHSTARALQNRIAPVSSAVTAIFGVPGLKAALDMVGFAGGDPRLPLLPLSGENRKKLRTILLESGLFAKVAE